MTEGAWNQAIRSTRSARSSGGRELRAALDQNPVDTRLGQRGKRHRSRSTPISAARHFEQLDPELGEGAAALGIGAFPDRDPGRDFARRRDEL